MSSNKLKGKLPPPRDPVAKNLPQKSGGGRHTDKKEQAKRGETKHKKQPLDLLELTDGKTSALDDIIENCQPCQFAKINYHNLGEHIDCNSKWKIIEAFLRDGNLLESNLKKNVFNSLVGLSDQLIAGNQYIVINLGLMMGKVNVVALLNNATFVNKDGENIIFEHNGTIKKFPDPAAQDIYYNHTFAFANTDNYNKFRTLVALQYNTKLPDINENIKENNMIDKLPKPTRRAIKDAPHKPMTGDTPVQVGQKAFAISPHSLSTVTTGRVTRISPDFVYLEISNGEEIRLAHDRVSRDYQRLHQAASSIIENRQNLLEPPPFDIKGDPNYQNHLEQRLNEALNPPKRKK